MTLPANTHWIAAVVLERLLYCLAEGSLVAAGVAIILKLAPERNSRTRFVAWLAALAAVVVLPLAPTGAVSAKVAVGSSSSPALLTVPGVVAGYIVLAWALVATLGLLRVAASLLQIRRLRRECFPVPDALLGPELRALIGELSSGRRVAVLVSPHLEVPTAIGFFRPAVLIPAWLADTADREELKYVLLHELAHLQRWDDWTNLAQKIAKALLFFHPGVWWIERSLSLDREMACDDLVLARAGSPRLYARCLARVAEKSFLRRQIILAQAAVDRARQLSARVAGILRADRPRSTQLWKPALPMVAIVSLLCAVSASNAPDLVSVSDGQPPREQAPLLPAQAVPRDFAAGEVFHQARAGFSPRSGAFGIVQNARLAAANTESLHAARAPLAKADRKPRPVSAARYTRSRRGADPELLFPAEVSGANDLLADNVLVNNRQTNEAPSSLSRGADEVAASGSMPDADLAKPRYGVVLVMMAGAQVTPGGSITWQINMWELRLPAPVERPAKPIPRKT